VATDNFVITTETAPNTSHFQGRHLNAAAAAAAARAAKAAGADPAAVAAAAAAAAADAAAAPATISEEDPEDAYEIEYSQDGSAAAGVFDSSATRGVLAAGWGAEAAAEREQQQQWQKREWESMQRLAGDLIYEMPLAVLPGVDDAAVWSTLPAAAAAGSYEEGQQQQGGYFYGGSSSTSTFSSSMFASTLGSSGGGSSGAAGGGGSSSSAAGSLDFLRTVAGLASAAGSSSRLRSAAGLGQLWVGGTEERDLMKEMSKAQVGTEPRLKLKTLYKLKTLLPAALG
jgi:hypothetical protein